MKKSTKDNLLPIIVVGKCLQQLYNDSQPKRKKVVAIKAGIEESNMRACLNPLKNIQKNTLRKIATGLEVCPIVFYVKKEVIDSLHLETHKNDSFLYVKNFDHLFRIMKIPHEKDEAAESINEEILHILDNLKEKIQQLEKTKIQNNEFKKSVIRTIIGLSDLI